MILNIIIAIVDGIGLTMFFPLIQIAGGVKEIDEKNSNNFISSIFSFIHLEITLVNVLIFMLLFFFIKGVLKYITILFRNIFQQHLIRKLRLQLLNGIERSAYTDFIKWNAGRLQNSLTGEVERISISFTYFFSYFEQFFLLFVYIIFAFFINYKFAFLVTLGGILTNFLYTKLYKKTEMFSSNFTSELNHYQGKIIQFIANYKYLKSTGNINTYSKRVKDSIFNLETIQLQIGKASSILESSREPILMSIVIIVIMIQVYVLNGNLSSIILSLLFFYRALSSLSSMQSHLNKFLGTTGSIKNIKKLVNEFDFSKEINGEKVFETFEKSIEFKSLNFKYENKFILNNLDLKINKYQTIAFIGESGSGKTTLVNIISGLLLPTSGSYTIDSINILDINRKTFQNKIGYITQETVIFDDTLFNNVTMWDKKTKENIDKFNTSIKKACLESFINSETQGHDLILGINGVNLSGGQKQRISIARELYREVEILILDEATSALDTDTEKNIQENIDLIKGQFTTIVIAHRLSTIKNVDKVYQLKEGKLINISAI
jgi:ABC-type multidrug transport system fused ATPase/permease subunit